MEKGPLVGPFFCVWMAAFALFLDIEAIVTVV